MKVWTNVWLEIFYLILLILLGVGFCILEYNSMPEDTLLIIKLLIIDSIFLFISAIAALITKIHINDDKYIL